MARLTIRMRLVLLASGGLLVLVATNAYLTRALSENSTRMVEAAGLLAGIEQADKAQIAFGEERYWMTDLAVSQLTLSERNAEAARARMEKHLGKLEPWNPERIAAVRSELARYDDFAAKAVDEYTNDRRVIGNSLLAEARRHSLAVDQLLAAIAEAWAADRRLVGVGQSGSGSQGRQRTAAEPSAGSQHRPAVRVQPHEYPSSFPPIRFGRTS